MIGTLLTIKNHDTGVQIVLNDHLTDSNNVIALQSFPTFEPEVRPQNVPKQGAHGEYRLPYYYSGMSIVLQGIIVGDTESDVWAIKEQFDAVMKMPNKGYPRPYEGVDAFPPMNGNNVRLSFTTPSGKEVFIDASPIKAVSYDRPLQRNFLLNFQVILRADFPYLLVKDDTPVIANGSLGALTEGFKVSTDLPLIISQQHITGKVNITVPSPSFAILTLNGSNAGVLVNPSVTNLTNGSQITIRRPLAGASSFFKIDGVYQTMTDQNGQSVKAYADGDFIFLDTGLNEIIYTAEDLIPY